MAATPAVIDDARSWATGIAAQVRPLISLAAVHGPVQRRRRDRDCACTQLSEGIMITWVGIDAVKHNQWACAVDAGGRALYGRVVPNKQDAIDALSAELIDRPEPVLVSIDVDGSVATFLQANGLALVHVPGLTVNRVAHGYVGGLRKSYPQDARVLMPTSREPATACGRSDPTRRPLNCKSTPPR